MKNLINKSMFRIICILFLFIIFFLFENKIERFNDADRNNRLFLFYLDSSNYQESIVYINKAIENNPYNPVHFANKAYALLLSQNIADSTKNENYLENNYKESTILEALELFKKASLLNDDPVYNNNIGWLNIFLGKFEEGNFYLEEALKKSPYDPYILIGKGFFEDYYLQSGEGLNYYNIAIENWPFLINTEWFSNDVFIKEDKLQLISLIQDVLKRNINNMSSSFQSRLAKLYLENHKAYEAKLLLQQSLKDLPNLNRSWLTLGNIFQNEGNYEQALICYQKSFFLDKSDPINLFFLKSLYNELGYIDKFEEFNDRYLISLKNYVPRYYINAFKLYKTQTVTQPYIPFFLNEILKPDFP